MFDEKAFGFHELEKDTKVEIETYNEDQPKNRGMRIALYAISMILLVGQFRVIRIPVTDPLSPSRLYLI